MCFYIPYNDKSYKSDITICVDCYLNKFYVKDQLSNIRIRQYIKKNLRKLLEKLVIENLFVVLVNCDYNRWLQIHYKSSL